MKHNVKIAIRIISAVVFLACVAGLLWYYIDDRNDWNVMERIAALLDTRADTADDTVLEQYQALVAENPDTIGWLKIDGTDIDNVVMHAPDTPEKYLHANFYGEHSYRGTLYVAEACDVRTSDNVIIYGHHMKDGSMFGALVDYQDEAFWRTHRYLRFDTIYAEQRYEVVAAFYTRILGENETGFRYYDYTGADDPEQLAEYVAFIEQNQCYDTGVGIAPGDRLLTLSTCAYQTTDGRFVVVAKQVPLEVAESGLS